MILYNIKSKLGVVNTVSIINVDVVSKQVEAFIVSLTEQEQLHHINAALNTAFKLYGDIIKYRYPVSCH